MCSHFILFSYSSSVCFLSTQFSALTHTLGRPLLLLLCTHRLWNVVLLSLAMPKGGPLARWISILCCTAPIFNANTITDTNEKLLPVHLRPVQCWQLIGSRQMVSLRYFITPLEHSFPCAFPRSQQQFFFSEKHDANENNIELNNCLLHFISLFIELRDSLVVGSSLIVLSSLGSCSLMQLFGNGHHGRLDIANSTLWYVIRNVRCIFFTMFKCTTALLNCSFAFPLTQCNAMHSSRLQNENVFLTSSDSSIRYHNDCHRADAIILLFRQKNRRFDSQDERNVKGMMYISMQKCNFLVIHN